VISLGRQHSTGRDQPETEHSGALGESLLRLFLGAVTLGATEILGMGDLGAGNEVGLLMTQWEIDGAAQSIAPPQRSSKVTP